MSAAPTPAPAPATLRQGRLGVAVACVALLHALALWGVQRAMERPWLRPVEALLSMSVRLIVPPPAPPTAPPPVARPAPVPVPVPAPVPRTDAPPIRQPAKPPKPPKPVVRRAPQAEPRPAPEAESQPVLRAELQPQPAPEAPEKTEAPEATARQIVEAVAPPSGAPAGPPAPSAAHAPVAAPSSGQEAQCLGNSRPPYPDISKRRGEEGQVIVSVLIGADGQVQEVKLQRSSGYTRLDDAALQAVRRWRCQPVVRDGVPQTQWRNVPVNFILRS